MGLFGKLFGNKEKKDTASATQQTAPTAAKASSENAASAGATGKMTEAMKHLSGISTVYYPVTRGLQDKWPSIDINGYIHAYRDENELKEIAAKNGFEVASVTGKKFCEELQKWAADGINRVRLSDTSKIIEYSREDLGLPEYTNGPLCQLIIRFFQAKALLSQKDSSENKATAATWWNILLHDITDTLFFVPMCYERDDINAPVTDGEMHVFPEAARVIMKKREKKEIVIVPGYPFAQASKGTIQFRMLHNQSTGIDVLPCYTSMEEMLKMWKGNARYALAAYDDMKNNYHPAAGILINPMKQPLFISPEIMKQIDEIRNKPVSVFTPQSKNNSKPKTVEDIIDLVKAHEPGDLNSPEGAKMWRQALMRILPAFDGVSDPLTLFWMNDIQKMKTRIASTDDDNLLIAFKYLADRGCSVKNEDVMKFIGFVQNEIIEVLLRRN